MEIEEEREQSHLVNLLSDNSITTIEVGETRLLLCYYRCGNNMKRDQDAEDVPNMRKNR